MWSLQVIVYICDITAFVLVMYRIAARPNSELRQKVLDLVLVLTKKVLFTRLDESNEIIISLKCKSYEQRLGTFSRPSLKFIRVRGDVMEVHKILAGKYYFLISPQFPVSSVYVTRGNLFEIINRRCHLRKFSFCTWITSQWNSCNIVTKFDICCIRAIPWIQEFTQPNPTTGCVAPLGAWHLKQPNSSSVFVGLIANSHHPAQQC